MKQAVLLVGGKGTRLGNLAAELPKPMLDVGGKPFVEYLIAALARHGFNEIILLCGHKASALTTSYDQTTLGTARIRCVVEKEPRGTGGALLEAEPWLQDEFLLLNGDSLFAINFLDLMTFAPGLNWVGKVALREVGDAGRYGAVDLHGDRIRNFAEKSRIGPGLINGGIYYLKKKILERISHLPCSLEQDLLPQLAEDDLLLGKPYSGYFIDIGIPSDLEKARSEVPRMNLPTIFFDRDGVLNHDSGYTHKKEDFRWIDGAIRAIKLFNDLGWLVIVVTNQAGIARGYYGEEDVIALHEWMQAELGPAGAHIDAFYFCPHHLEGTVPNFTVACDCRKPNPGMLLAAMNEWPIDRAASFLIGDKDSDIEAARAAGVKAEKFRGGNLFEFVQRIVSNV